MFYCQTVKGCCRGCQTWYFFILSEVKAIYIGSLMIYGLIWISSNSLCVFLSPRPIFIQRVMGFLSPARALARDKKHTTGWMKIISNHKPWEILFITYFNLILTIHPVLVVFCHAKDPSVISTILRFWKSSLWRHNCLIWKFIQWVISTGYGGKYVIKSYTCTTSLR